MFNLPPVVECRTGQTAYSKTLESIMRYISESDATEQYDNLLDEVYGEITVSGITWDASRILAEMDPTAYWLGMNDWLDSEDLTTDESEADPEDEEDDDECLGECRGHEDSDRKVSFCDDDEPEEDEDDSECFCDEGHDVCELHPQGDDDDEPEGGVIEFPPGSVLLDPETGEFSRVGDEELAEDELDESADQIVSDNDRNTWSAQDAQDFRDAKARALGRLDTFGDPLTQY